MKYYNVYFRATVDCSMAVCLDNDEEPSDVVLLGAIQDRVSRNDNISDWLEPDDRPVITGISYNLEEEDES